MALSHQSRIKPMGKPPEDASYEDIQYHIYVRQAIQRGVEAADRGELVEQEEVERRTAK